MAHPPSRMPELPEVEVLVKHLDRVLVGRRIRHVTVLHPKLCRPTPPALLQAQLTGHQFQRVTRRRRRLPRATLGL